MPYYYIIAACATVFFIGLYIVLDRFIKNEKAKSWILKGLALLFTLVFVCRYLSDTIAIKKTIFNSVLNIRLYHNYLSNKLSAYHSLKISSSHKLFYKAQNYQHTFLQYLEDAYPY